MLCKSNIKIKKNLLEIKIMIVCIEENSIEKIG